MIIKPKGIVDLRFSIFRFDFFSEAGDQKPQRVVFDIPFHLRSIKKWEWQLVQWSKDFTLSLNNSSPPSLSSLLFERKPASKGTFKVKNHKSRDPHSLIVWSCNQPFSTAEDGSPILDTYSNLIFEWYANQVSTFNPDLIWGLGDTGYSDGTESTDFINQYYDNNLYLSLESGKKALLQSYRRMYKAHWSFTPMQYVMRNYPHICVWDDHEIRDGWGSELNDFENGNTAIFQQARISAEEYILNNGPRVRRAINSKSLLDDAHQAYTEGNIASFVFDGRSSRKYNDPGGKVISENQLDDFNLFCRAISKKKEIKFLLMGSAVPFINLIDFIENIGSKTPDLVNNLTAGLRDDIRDSWHSPGNLSQLKKLISIIRRLHRNRPDMNFVNISGDIHVANLFSFQPLGFTKALYQVTTSAITNRSHPNDHLNDLIQIGTEAWSEALGIITRIWPTVSDPNILTIKPVGQSLELTLKVFDLDQESPNVNTLVSLKDLIYRVGTHKLVGEHLLPV